MKEWTTDIPTEEGHYWFYGDIVGGMGSHFTDDFKPEPEFIHVQVSKITNGMIFVGQGRFLPDRKFDKKIRKEGVIGYWKKIDHEIPEDSENFFG